MGIIVKTETQIATTASAKPPSRTAAVMTITTRAPTIRVDNFRASGISLKSLSCNDTYKQKSIKKEALFSVNILRSTLLQGKQTNPVKFCHRKVIGVLRVRIQRKSDKPIDCSILFTFPI